VADVRFSIRTSAEFHPRSPRENWRTVVCRRSARRLRDTYRTESIAQSNRKSIQMTSPLKTADRWICRFCQQSDTQPFEGFIRPWKKLFFAGFRQLVYFLYQRRRGKPLTISTSGSDMGKRCTLGWVSKGRAGVNVDVPIS
jgi:hypothetical protein